MYEEDIEDQEPLLTIKGGLSLDKYKLTNAIKEALKDVEFDIQIYNMTVRARKKEPEPEKPE